MKQHSAALVLYVCSFVFLAEIIVVVVVVVVVSL